jgi:AP-3 complex subunit beta
MGLVATDCEPVVAEAVIAIRQLLQQHPEHDSLIVRLAKRLPTTKGASARAAIVWIVGEFQNKVGLYRLLSVMRRTKATLVLQPRVAAMAPDALRVLAKNFKRCLLVFVVRHRISPTLMFCSESSEVKYQILNLAAKTSLYQPDSKPVSLLLKYTLELARYVRIYYHPAFMLTS